MSTQTRSHVAPLDLKPGMRISSGWTVLGEPAEQPDGSVSALMQNPQGGREVFDFIGAELLELEQPDEDPRNGDAELAMLEESIEEGSR